MSRTADLWWATEPVVESLEARALMSGTALDVTQATVTFGKELRVAGTSGNDQITVTRPMPGSALRPARAGRRRTPGRTRACGSTAGRGTTRSSSTRP